MLIVSLGLIWFLLRTSLIPEINCCNKAPCSAIALSTTFSLGNCTFNKSISCSCNRWKISSVTNGINGCNNCNKDSKCATVASYTSLLIGCSKPGFTHSKYQEQKSSQIKE